VQLIPKDVMPRPGLIPFARSSRSRSALSASRARIIPPSPVRSTLLWLKLKQPKSPIAPANESPIAETVGMGVVLDHRCSGLGGDLHDRVHVDGERLNSSSSASPKVS
jgi:hypothetical protein